MMVSRLRKDGRERYSLEIIKAVGYWFPEGFKHCFVDNIWEELGRETGCWRVRMDVMIKHLHPFKTGDFDDTGKRVYSPAFWNNDEQAYKTWTRFHKQKSIQKLGEYLVR